MKVNLSSKWQHALTRIEVCVILAVVALGLCAMIPALIKEEKRAKAICCNCNLKQIGLGFRTWGLDHTNFYPMALSTNFGGTQEYLATGETFRHFQVMSNELSTPVILACPSDSRRAATTFGPGFSNSNVSYFVGLVVNDDNPQMLLAGDRGITGGTRLPAGIAEFTTNDAPAWRQDIHKGFGNVALADGSVQGFSTSSLREALRHTGAATNRLAFP